MPDRSQDRLRQAQRDFEQARESLRSGRHEWACSAAHQAAEEAVKALYRARAQEARGRCVARLLGELPPELGVASEPAGMATFRTAVTLLPAKGTPTWKALPSSTTGSRQSRQAVEYARQTLDFVGAQMA